MRVLLNGVGRIGKAILRIAESRDSFKIVAINELNTNIKNIAYSINYDSTYGKITDKYTVSGNTIVNKNGSIKIFNSESFFDIDLVINGIDIIIDASGSKINLEDIRKKKHLPLYLTHPNIKADKNVIIGVNENEIDYAKDKIISTSSCNATALLPILKLLDDTYKIEYGDITTIHPLLNHQKTLDSACIGSKNRDVECNFEFGRSSTQNMIPSKTTTIDACSYILPSINHDMISSSSIRVPTTTVGAINVTVTVERACTKESLIKLLNDYESNQKYKIILNNTCPLVSSDFQGEEYTSIIDHRFIDVKKNKMIKIVIWYDNEWGYASKVVDIISRHKLEK
ncbi:glyceraldehyde 3-phosphate dehydrogenase NAD-binding domain-containing protein [Arcobacteraceae bacterium]|nr:glyceraldehyde 3-phosphate dehydrogenase NAD-binding domain-containing protein [Arcobacteraceae bacterium]